MLLSLGMIEEGKFGQGLSQEVAIRRYCVLRWYALPHENWNVIEWSRILLYSLYQMNLFHLAVNIIF